MKHAIIAAVTAASLALCGAMAESISTAPPAALEPEAVYRLETRLAELGYYSGKADGGYGPKMVAAVKAAQAAFGLEQTGIADVAFQQHLYGSVTAPTEAPTEAPEAAADEEG